MIFDTDLIIPLLVVAGIIWLLYKVATHVPHCIVCDKKVEDIYSIELFAYCDKHSKPRKRNRNGQAR